MSLSPLGLPRPASSHLDLWGERRWFYRKPLHCGSEQPHVGTSINSFLQSREWVSEGKMNAAERVSEANGAEQEIE